MELTHRGFNVRNWRLSRVSRPNWGLRDGEGVGVIAFRPAVSRRYRLHQTERRISQSPGCGVNLSECRHRHDDFMARYGDIFFKTRN